MAEKNKKRGGRRAHLNDFHVNLAGDYVYTGAHYFFGIFTESLILVLKNLLFHDTIRKTF